MNRPFRTRRNNWLVYDNLLLFSYGIAASRQRPDVQSSVMDVDQFRRKVLDMAIWHEEKQGCFIVHIDEEELAEADLDRIRQVLTVAFLHKRYNLVLDVSACRMVDSYFIGLLISTFREVRELGGNLRVAGANEQVWHAFEVIRLDRVMDICDDVNVALEHYAKDQQG